MKSVLPPKAVDTPDELAELSQFLVNVIDFRDPDCTMTHFRNPDVKVVLGTISGGTTPTYQPTYLALIDATIPAASTAIPLDQYGMEYNPVAINEALAYSFAISSGSGESNRFFVELVNTLSQSALGLLPANDFGAGITNPPDVSILDLSLANYDLVMTADDPVSRPDPFTGQLLPISSANYYAQLPLNQANSAATNPLFTPALTVPPSGDVQLTPLYSVGAPGNPPAAADFPTSPTSYFFVIGSPLASGTETAPINATANLSPAYDPLSPTAPPATTTLERRSSGLLPEPAVRPRGAGDAPAGYHQVKHNAAQDNAPRGGLGHDAVLLALPAAASQSVRAAPGRHQSVDV